MGKFRKLVGVVFMHPHTPAEHGSQFARENRLVLDAIGPSPEALECLVMKPQQFAAVCWRDAEAPSKTDFGEPVQHAQHHDFETVAVGPVRLLGCIEEATANLPNQR